VKGKTMTVPDETASEPTAPPPEQRHVPGVTLEQLERHKAELRRELEESRTKDQGQIAELKQQIAEFSEFIKEQKKALLERENKSDSQHTLVVPPPELLASLREQDKPADEGTINEPTGGEDRHRKGFWRIW
jgi:flagellar motility protein MotE (MotC chaperone)